MTGEGDGCDGSDTGGDARGGVVSAHQRGRDSILIAGRHVTDGHEDGAGLVVAVQVEFEKANFETSFSLDRRKG